MGEVLLVIEDDPLVSRMYQKAFKFEGFDVETAKDGHEGITKANEIKPEVILLDIMMPKMNGMEVLERLKTNDELKDIPVIVLTNLSGTQDAENALKRGALAYLVKSEYKPNEVAKKVKEILAKKIQTASQTTVSVTQTKTTQKTQDEEEEEN
jgi:DNA-binding response OmpR family regulator